MQLSELSIHDNEAKGQQDREDGGGQVGASAKVGNKAYDVIGDFFGACDCCHPVVLHQFCEQCSP